MKKVPTSQETELSVMMDLTNIIDAGDGRLAHSKEILTVEQNALIELGPRIASCVEKLLCLALSQAQFLTAQVKSISPDNKMKFVLNEFSAVLITALDYTELETKVGTFSNSFHNICSLLNIVVFV